MTAAKVIEDIDDLPPDEQAKGSVVKQVTAIASYRWQNRTLRTTVHGTVEIQLDTTRIRRRRGGAVARPGLRD